MIYIERKSKKSEEKHTCSVMAAECVLFHLRLTRCPLNKDCILIAATDLLVNYNKINQIINMQRKRKC